MLDLQLGERHLVKLHTVFKLERSVNLESAFCAADHLRSNMQRFSHTFWRAPCPVRLYRGITYRKVLSDTHEEGSWWCVVIESYADCG